MLNRVRSLLGEIGLGSAVRSGSDLVDTNPPASIEVPSSGAASVRADAKVLPEFGLDGISFGVDDVVPARDPLWQGSLLESAEIRANSRILVIPGADLPCLAPEGYFVPRGEAQAKPRRVGMQNRSSAGSVAQQIAARRTFLHPLVQAVHLAFGQHRPLVISPDAIWLTLVQGFGHHVNENAEDLRGRIVRHDGKKQLQVTTESLDPAGWPRLINRFSELIRENSDPVLHETLVCEFSTTTSNIKTAYEVALMDTYQRYFDYSMVCVCGIPKVTVLGTPEDWRRIRERIEVLATYGLEWWTSRVTPILDQLVATAEGYPDRAFWQAIYKPQETYGADLASGWIADLFPYLFGAPPSSDVTLEMYSQGRRSAEAVARRNHVLSMPRNAWLLPAREVPGWGVGVRLESFPSGLSRAPLDLSLPRHLTKKVVLLGGFLGVSQRSEDNALAPVMSWALAQPDWGKQKF